MQISCDPFAAAAKISNIGRVQDSGLRLLLELVLLAADQGCTQYTASHNKPSADPGCSENEKNTGSSGLQRVYFSCAAISRQTQIKL